MGDVEKRNFTIMQLSYVLLLVLTLFSPIVFVISLLPLIVLTAFLFIKNFRLNYFVNIVLMVTMCVISSGDLVTVIFALLLILGSTGVIVGLKVKSYLLGVAICTCIMLFSSVLPFAFYCPMTGKNIGELASDYLVDNAKVEMDYFSNGPIIRVSAKIYYNFYTEENYNKLTSDDKGYEEEVVVKFSELIKSWAKEDFFYDFLGIVSVISIAAYLLTLLLSKKKLFYISAMKTFKIKTEYVNFVDMRLNRTFMLCVFLPAMLFACLGYYDSFSGNVAAIINSMLTVPAAFACFSFLFHTANRIYSNIKYLFYSLFILLAIMSLFFSVAMLIAGMIGLADAILNLRKYLNYALDDERGNLDRQKEIERIDSARKLRSEKIKNKEDIKKAKSNKKKNFNQEENKK